MIAYYIMSKRKTIRINVPLMRANTRSYSPMRKLISPNLRGK
jgi:hypothetical protein